MTIETGRPSAPSAGGTGGPRAAAPTEGPVPRPVGILAIPVLTDRALGVVVSVRPPSAAAASAARPVFYRDVADFEHHLTTREWAAAIVDIGHFEDRSSHPDGIRPFWRLDVVDQLRRLRTMDERPLLALVRDRYDLAAQLTVAEAAGCTPSLVGAITSLDEVDGAVRELAGDGVSWLAVDRDRVVALQAFLSTLGDEGRRKTGYWMRHLLVAAAAGQPGPQSLAALLHFRMQTVKTWSSRVDRELRKTFDHAPPGYPMTMIAATAQALQPWLWRWTRRHRGHFEYGFLERVLPDAF